MNLHLPAIAALLTDVDLPAYDTVSDRPDYDPTGWDNPWTAAQKQAWVLVFPHVILSMPTPREVALSLSRGALDVDDYVRATYVGDSIRSTRWIGERVRDALDHKPVAGDGFVGLLTLSSVAPVTVDRDVNLPNTGNPVYGSDLYHYRATSAPSGS